MNTPKPIFVREVARIDDPQFVSGHTQAEIQQAFADYRAGRF